MIKNMSLQMFLVKGRKREKERESEGGGVGGLSDVNRIPINEKCTV